PALNERGATAFIGAIAGDRAPELDASAVWVERDSGLEAIARFGDPTSDVTPEIRYRWFHDLVLNNSGAVAFSGSTVNQEGMLSMSLWRDQGESTELIFAGRREENANSGGSLDRLTPPSMNASGEMAFRSYSLDSFDAVS
ncbi:unnamed protein product, partial [Ectocarpus sp. 4 AP-2014]